MTKNKLFLTNTLSRNKEEFKPQTPGKILMYVCGVTPYDNAHIGHGRCYVTFDVLYRLLQFLGNDVAYARNFTDIDDKLLNRAEKELGDRLRYQEIAEKYIKSFTQDMHDLNCLTPTFQPRATQTIDAMIDLIQRLIEKGHAYVVDGDVYYAVRSFPEYGKLSKRQLEDLQAGARVEINDKKRDPLDFALWKTEPEGTFWKSPWGYGRPGWHIECSAMASTLLAPHIDLHGGGMDLIFPHHENEIAQSEGVYGPNFANYWLHNAFVRINQEKMSKSLGNFFTIRDIFKEFDPMVVRFYYLNHNYNIPLDFSHDGLQAAEKSYKRLVRVFEDVNADAITNEQLQQSSIIEKMLSFLCDDLNTAGVFGVLFENLDQLKAKPEEAAMVKRFLNIVLGLTLLPLKEKIVEITPGIQALIDQRETARVAKDWAMADKIRDQLRAMGVELQDKKL
ncbi:TPA: cysteine--tRNA ligase [Candidatus Dependentiae bacterium]|nr:MAG: Cysteine-tRNA ligase [candidate division TM6 bacterium GW2011_GWF2_36_131]KKQ02929.1 MAG: Cysteine-tRNA ligase [candidate division TM6 bacterium GW2011_GWE2_36_25]KKQ19702.1 MAG: Cysteine-tRNA ligase [candidate division TM6 bacterium GW2011_GWA2_36_9]HBR70965.1 cysteine--tRNA ligase [Candidatus Dependentiae bacterium]HCU00358.1 cysteine--tRNA ligase [Candidatus Dependentiae bacterium]